MKLTDAFIDFLYENDRCLHCGLHYENHFGSDEPCPEDGLMSYCTQIDCILVGVLVDDNRFRILKGQYKWYESNQVLEGTIYI